MTFPAGGKISAQETCVAALRSDEVVGVVVSDTQQLQQRDGGDR